MTMLTGEAIELPSEKWSEDPKLLEMYRCLRSIQRLEQLSFARVTCGMFARLASSLSLSNLVAGGDAEKAIDALVAPGQEGMSEDDYVSRDFATIDDITAYFQRTMKTFMIEAMIEQLKCDRDALQAEKDRLDGDNRAAATGATSGGPVLTVVKSDVQNSAA